MFYFYVSIVMEVNIYVRYMVMIFLICKKITSSIIHWKDPAPHIHAVSTSVIDQVSYMDCFASGHYFLFHWLFFQHFDQCNFFSFIFLQFEDCLGHFDLLYFNINFRICIWIYAQRILRSLGVLQKKWQLYIIKSAEYENGISLCS